jgi:hypothetical protein
MESVRAAHQDLVDALNVRINDLQSRVAVLSASVEASRDAAATQRMASMETLAKMETRAQLAETRFSDSEKRLVSMATIARAARDEAGRLRSLLARELERARAERAGSSTVALQRDAVMAAAFVSMSGKSAPTSGIKIPSVPHSATRAGAAEEAADQDSGTPPHTQHDKVLTRHITIDEEIDGLLRRGKE